MLKVLFKGFHLQYAKKIIFIANGWNAQLATLYLAQSTVMRRNNSL